MQKMNLKLFVILLTITVCKADTITSKWIELSAACQDSASSVLELRSGEALDPTELAKIVVRISKAKSDLVKAGELQELTISLKTPKDWEEATHKEMGGFVTELKKKYGEFMFNELMDMGIKKTALGEQFDKDMDLVVSFSPEENKQLKEIIIRHKIEVTSKQHKKK